MNRKARLVGANYWHSYGEVTIAEAASLHAENVALGDLISTPENQRDQLDIEVDDGEGNVRTYRCTREQTWTVHGLRGGE